MRKKLSFEQVPLEAVRRVVQEQVKHLESESDREAKEKELEQLEQVLHWAGNGKSGKAERT